MNVTSIVDFSQDYLQVTNEGQVLLIKKSYVNVQINPINSNLVDFRFHWYELNSGQRLFYLDFNIIVAPITGSAAALLTAIQGFLISQFGGSVANASETVKGIVEEATQTELNAGTDTGATGAKLFIVPSKLAVYIQQAALTIDAIWHFVSAKLRLFNAAKSFYVAFTTPASANRSQAFQDASGTIALTSDIPAAYTDEQAQDAVGTILVDSTTIDFTYSDATPSITAIVIDDSITNAKLANMANSTIKGRVTAGTGDPEDLTAAQVKTVIGAIVLTTDVNGVLPIANGGTAAATAAAARTNLLTQSILTFGSTANNLYTASVSRYFGGITTTAGATGVNDQWRLLPYARVCTGAIISVRVAGTLGSSQTATVSLRYGAAGASSLTLSTGVKFDAAWQSYAVTGLSQALAANDQLSIQVTTGAFTTAPTTVTVLVDLILE